MKKYQIEKVNEQTGEVAIVSQFKYLPGRPKQYRFNGQNGQFNIGGEEILLGLNGKPLQSFTFTPIAFRVFTDHLFGRKDEKGQPRRDEWGEFYFIDDKSCVSSIMFNGTSLTEFFNIADPLYYEDKNLLDVTLTVTPERITKGDKNWFLCRWKYADADAEAVAAYREFVQDFDVFRADTLTPEANITLQAGTDFTGLILSGIGGAGQLEEATEQRLLN